MRIVVAEDAALIRAGLIEVLTSAGHEVVGAVGDTEALESRVAALHEAGADPDLVMSDVRMPPGNADDGLRAAIRLRRRHPGLPVLLLSAYIGGRYLRQLVQDEAAHGGIGYLMKERVSHVREFLIPRRYWHGRRGHRSGCAAFGVPARPWRSPRRAPVET